MGTLGLVFIVQGYWELACIWGETAMLTISKDVQGCRDSSAQTTETRCRDGSLKERRFTKTTQVIPSLRLFLIPDIIL